MKENGRQKSVIFCEIRNFFTVYNCTLLQHIKKLKIIIIFWC